jgi:uncharacterized protein involved in response to NO
MNRMTWRRFAALAAEEPFRVLFPLGTLIALIGVLLWPAFYSGMEMSYPATSHARLMIQGTMGCFIFGFLGTAGPRLMGVPHFTGGEVLRLLLLIVASTGAHLLALHLAGDLLFLVALLLFVFSLGRRFPKREDSPPPNFLLVALGLLNGVAGTALLVWSQTAPAHPTGYRLGMSLLNIGFVLLPLLGVAPFFLRRLLDQSTDLQEHRTRHLLLSLGTAAVIEASLLLEQQTAFFTWPRAGAALLYLAIVPPWRGRNTLAGALRMSLAAAVAGLGLVALLPAYRISALHVLFVGGFGVAVFSVATRVVLGHSGRIALVAQRRGWLITAFVLVILGMWSRFVADFVATRNSHLVSAAICWAVGVAIWSAIVLPKIAETDE